MAVVRHKEAIHSGHFMVSNFEAEAQDDEEDIAVPVRITKLIVVNRTSWWWWWWWWWWLWWWSDFLLLQRFLRRKPHRRLQTSSRRMSKIVSSKPLYFLPYHHCLFYHFFTWSILSTVLYIPLKNLCILHLASFMHLCWQSKLLTEFQVKQAFVNLLFPT